MMGRQTADQSQLIYLFNLEQRIPASHLLHRINWIATQVLAELYAKLTLFYSAMGRPSVAPELILRMLIIGFCYGIRFVWGLYEEVDLHLAYRWFSLCHLDDCPRSVPCLRREIFSNRLDIASEQVSTIHPLRRPVSLLDGIEG